jgi:lipoate-protein ligase A
MLKNLHYYKLNTFSGKENMAFDEVISGSLADSKQWAFLRFYRWNPHCLSFGYNQPIEKLIRIDVASNLGVDIVRRASGGRMVYHADEITFSMGAPTEFLRDKVRENTFLNMFKLLMEPIVSGMRAMNLNVEFAGPEKKGENADGANCYATAAGHSVFMDGRKLIGAAGIVKRDCLMIHGSIPCSISYPPEEIFFNKASAGRNLQISSLSERLSDSQICELPGYVANSFLEKFALKLKEKEISVEEKKLIEELAENKFSNYRWTT